jgi:hypothetical protein
MVEVRYDFVWQGVSLALFPGSTRLMIDNGVVFNMMFLGKVCVLGCLAGNIRLRVDEGTVLLLEGYASAAGPLINPAAQ